MQIPVTVQTAPLEADIHNNERMMSHVKWRKVAYRQVRKERGVSRSEGLAWGYNLKCKRGRKTLEKVTSGAELEDQGGNHAKSGERISRKRNSKCKGPGVGIGLGCCVTRQLTVHAE